MTTTALALVGAGAAAADRPERADGPVILVTASYPGANARVVADSVAAPVEQQINGVEGMVRIESKSGNDGRYIANVHFEPTTDPKSATRLVQNRVALATSLLPDEVRRSEVSVKLGKTEADPNEVAVAVIDHQGHGWEALQKAAGAAVKRLAADGALTKPQAFPRDEKQVSIELDRAKCAALGVPVADVNKAIQAAGLGAKVAELRKLGVRDKVSLGEVATIKEVTGPGAVYRVKLHPAIRITGAPPAGKTVAVVAARCVDLAKAEIKRLDSGAFAVEDLSAK